MENLPLLVLQKIFSEMSCLNEMIGCSLVCRNWRLAYETLFKPETLCLYPDAYMKLNHRLQFTVEKLTKFNFLKISDDLQFLQSAAARAHFVNVKKLVLFEFTQEADYHFHTRVFEFSFREHLNHFKCLEYLEIRWRKMILKDSLIDLPKLKTLRFQNCVLTGEIVQISLNTPSLEALQLFFRELRPISFAEGSRFKCSFPQKLRYLQFVFHQENFKFDTRFENLERLVISYGRPPYQNTIEKRVLSDDFLEDFPKLKILLTDNLNPPDHSDLERQKKKFNLNELKCVQFDLVEYFDYANWQTLLQQAEQFGCWPAKLCANFNELINCQIPRHYFKESYFNLSSLAVGRVSDQSLLIELLKSIRIDDELGLTNEFNLGQDFFDEIAEFLTIPRLLLFESTLNRLNDFAFLTKLNFFGFSLYFERFPREAISTVLKKPTGYQFNLSNYHSESQWLDNEDGFNTPQTEFLHNVLKRTDDFYCYTCGFKSERDPNFSDALIESFLQHLENGQDFSQSNGPYVPEELLEI